MTTDPKLGRRLQLAAPGAQVELYDLDLTPISSTAPILYFYPGSNETAGAGQIVWRGNTYFPLPIKIEGIDQSSKGSLPRPILSVSNILQTVTALIQTYGRVSGAILTRWVTFESYLDNGDDPNPSGYLPVDQYILDRVQLHNRMEVQIECRSFLDFGTTNAPSRIVFQSACTHTYRTYNTLTNTFDYSKATCPYSAGPTFDNLGNAASANADDCGRRISDCRLRFGNLPLPYRGFPGVGRYK